MRVGAKVVGILLLVLLAVWGVAERARTWREAAIVEGELRRDHQIFGSALAAALRLDDGAGRDLRDARALLDAVELAERAIALEVVPGRAPPSQEVTDGHLVTRVPVALREGPAVLELREPMTEVDRVLAEGRRHFLLGGLVLFGLGLVAASVGGGLLVGRRLDRLVEWADAMGRGDLSPRPPDRGADEIGRLAAAFEALTADLRAARERARAEAEARVAAVEQLRHADRLRLVGDLAAGVAHELGSPLHVVSAQARSIAEDPEVSDDVRQAAGVVRDQARRMRDLVSRLLELAHPRPRPAAPVAVRALVAQARPTLDALTRGTGVTLEVGALPEATVALRESWFVQVLANLVRNAVQAQPEGGAVRLAGRVDGGRVRLDVDDAGPGLGGVDVETLFRPFYTTKAPGEGLGLGLALARGLLEEAGGALEVGRSPLGGARFTLILLRVEEPP